MQDRHVRKAKALLGAFVATLICAAPLAIGAAPASAKASCVGSSCDHKNPVAQGCAADGYVAAHVTFSEGAAGSHAKLVVALMYSPTCKASWSRATAQGDGTISVDWRQAWMGAGHKSMTIRTGEGAGRTASKMLSGSTVTVCGKASWNDGNNVKRRCTSAG